MKPKIFVTRKIPAGIDILEEFCDVTVRDKPDQPSKEELFYRYEED